MRLCSLLVLALACAARAFVLPAQPPAGQALQCGDQALQAHGDGQAAAAPAFPPAHPHQEASAAQAEAAFGGAGGRGAAADHAESDACGAQEEVSWLYRCVISAAVGCSLRWRTVG